MLPRHLLERSGRVCVAVIGSYYQPESVAIRRPVEISVGVRRGIDGIDDDVDCICYVGQRFMPVPTIIGLPGLVTNGAALLNAPAPSVNVKVSQVRGVLVGQFGERRQPGAVGGIQTSQDGKTCPVGAGRA